MTIYQLDDSLINDGTVGEQLGLGVTLEGPVCELYYAPDFLEHNYDLNFSSADTALVVSGGRTGRLPAHDGMPAMDVEAGPIRFGFTHLWQEAHFDYRAGSTVYFTAWSAP